MIQKNIKQYEIYKPEVIKDAYAQSKLVHTYSHNADISIFIKEQKMIETDPRYIKATHVGLTKCNTDIDENYKIKGPDVSYIVKLMLPSGSLYKHFLLEKE